jgi:hypothetical protein
VETPGPRCAICWVTEWYVVNHVLIYEIYALTWHFLGRYRASSLYREGSRTSAYWSVGSSPFPGRGDACLLAFIQGVSPPCWVPGVSFTLDKGPPPPTPLGRRSFTCTHLHGLTHLHSTCTCRTDGNGSGGENPTVPGSMYGNLQHAWNK